MKVEVAVLGTRFCGRKATLNNNNLTLWAAFASVYHPHVPCDPRAFSWGVLTTTTTPPCGLRLPVCTTRMYPVTHERSAGEYYYNNNTNDDYCDRYH